MRWRCVACGRPHEDPGGECACGSEEFERMVVQVSKRCTTCGTAVPEATTTCPECGFTGFETIVGEDAEVGEQSYVEWRCASCGRSHPKHNPPCSRCGHEKLERHRVDADEVAVDDVVGEFGGGSILDGFDRTTVAGAGIVVVVFVLIWAFVPGAALPGNAPSPADVNETALEDELVVAVNEERTEEGLAALERRDDLDGAASDLATAAAAGEPMNASAGTDCSGATDVGWHIDGDAEWRDGEPTAEEVAGLLASDVSPDDPEAVLLAEDADRIGVGTARADGDLFVVAVVC